MLQLGWATACSGVTPDIACRVKVRNGPPEAVRIMRDSRWAQGCCSTWNTAECSKSTGITAPPAASATRRSDGPKVTRLSLLARPTIAPVRAAAMAGLRPAVPTIDAITQSEGRAAASSTADCPTATSTPSPARADFELGLAALVGQNDRLRPPSPRLLDQELEIAARGQGDHFELA